MAFQVGSAFLDACVLAVLAREDTYGYVLTQKMRLVVDISESTLYPVLRRLQKGGYLSTYDSPYQGRNRRYYRITEDGMKQYESYRDEWIWHRTQVDELMFGTEVQKMNEEVNLEKDAPRTEPEVESKVESIVESGAEPEAESNVASGTEPEVELKTGAAENEQGVKEVNETGGGTEDE